MRSGKNLEATDKGIRLIDVVHPEVKSPAMTGQWEAYLKRIERGQAQLAPFLDGIEEYVREVVGKVGQNPRRRDSAAPTGPFRQAGSRAQPEPASQAKPLHELLHRVRISFSAQSGRGLPHP